MDATEEGANRRMEHQRRMGEIRAALDAFSKATSMRGGPSLAMQRHDPTWETWKKLCDVIYA
jgi:hypothetical protein